MTATPAGSDAAARALFARFGTTAVGAWSAPGRVNLIGEHTDYNEGFVLPFAIDRRTHVVAGVGREPGIRVASTFADDPVAVDIDDLDALFPTGGSLTVPAWSAYPLGVAWALRHAASAPRIGVDVAIASEVPIGSGLSSSAAIESAVAVALNDIWQLELDPLTLAQVGRRAENDAVGAPTGIMDQMAAMRGRRDGAIFLDCRTLDCEVIDLGFASAGMEVVVIDTGVTHEHATGGYRDRRESCERGAAILGVPALRDVQITDLEHARTVLDDVTFRRVRHVVTENRRVHDAVQALRGGDVRAVGALLDASHTSMRDDFEISTPELDAAVDAAREAGAVGARMTGGGFGGAAIALTPADRIDAVRDAASAAFAASGFSAPHVFTVTPSDGARRDH